MSIEGSVEAATLEELIHEVKRELLWDFSTKAFNEIVRRYKLLRAKHPFTTAALHEIHEGSKLPLSPIAQAYKEAHQ